MSVTFQIEANPTGSYSFTCYAGAPKEYKPYPSYQATLEAIATHQSNCEECAMFHPSTSPILDVDSSMNVSNTNACILLDSLGIEYDPSSLCGSMKAEDLLGHTLMALGMPIDNAPVPTVSHQNTNEHGQPVGAIIHYVGLEANYVTVKIKHLADMATEALKLGRDISWG